ncbi:MAG: peptide ABC transporter substrate-binding protein [Clostridia bacterium]|nr:peptide ABC transporter substrate-binding protein [Clostridia bacterium]
MRKRLLCLLLAVWIAVTPTGCRKNKDGTGGGFRFPIAAEPTGLDPQMATDDSAITVLCALFEGLTRLDNSGKAIPAAADWTVSEDGLTYTFALRESYWGINTVKGETHPWDKNLPVTADDFVFGLSRIADPATASPLAAELIGIANAEAVIAGKKPVEELGIKAVDDRTLTITLSAPDDDFPAKLATSPFFPCHRAFFEYTAGRYGLESKYLLTNGPFRLTEWDHGNSLLLYKHEQYHEAANIAPEAVRFVIGTADAVEALNSGDLSAAPLTLSQALKVGKNVKTALLRDAVRSVWLNTSADPLTVANIRTALRDAIQWRSVDAYLQSAGEAVANGYVPPAATVDGETYRTTDNALPRTTDAEGAVKSLQAGLKELYPDGGGSASRIRIELLAADDPVSADLARYILQSWQKNLGITVTLKLIPESDLASRVKNGNYQAALYTHTPSGLTGAENLSSFASAATDNLPRLVDKKVDAAIDAAKEGGREALTALEQAVWEACPAIPIGFPCRYYGFAADTEGIVARPFGGGRYQSPLDFRGAKIWD